MAKSLSEQLDEARDIVDELWINARATYTQDNLETLDADLADLRLSAESFEVRADLYKNSYRRISQRELGRSYEAQVEFQCLSARLAQIKGEQTVTIEQHLYSARQYQDKLKQLTSD
jgi:hypothetical protein